jgi:hypothetical protein
MLVTFTVAPWITAFPESKTLPLIVPRASCALAVEVSRVRVAKTAMKNACDILDFAGFIVAPPESRKKATAARP